MPPLYGVQVPSFSQPVVLALISVASKYTFVSVVPVNASASVMRQNSRQGDDTVSAVRTSDTQSSLRELSEGTGGLKTTSAGGLTERSKKLKNRGE